MSAEHQRETTSADVKFERYAELAQEIGAVIQDEPSLIARMATIAAMLAEAFPVFSWTGFYLVDEQRRELVIGPYQGTLACLRIRFGEGVCGVAAANGRAEIVPNVHSFPGHIACDSRSNSEIVVPVWNPTGSLMAVLDVDSIDFAAFDERDAAGLSHILRRSFGAEQDQ